MDANEREFIFKSEVYAIISCALEIINGMGHGFHEKPNENALAVEFSHGNIPLEKQKIFPVIWRNTLVGEFIPDLIANGKIVIDTKTIERTTGLQVGLIINFKKPKLEWERIVLSF